MSTAAGQRPLVTILLPTHERPDVLPLAIASAQSQTVSDWELLICGDGCAPETAAVLEPLLRADPRLKWFDLPKGPGFGYANRNRVLEHARGLWHAFLAHDDLWLPDHLERLLARAGATESAEPGPVLVLSRPIWVSLDGILIPFYVDPTQPDQRQRFAQRNLFPASCMLYAAPLLAASGGWPEEAERAGDWLMWQGMLAQGAELRLEPAATLLHFVAIWKGMRDSGLREVRRGLILHDAAPWWPEALRLLPGPGAEPPADPSALQRLAVPRFCGPEWRAAREDLDRAMHLLAERMAWEWLSPGGAFPRPKDLLNAEWPAPA